MISGAVSEENLTGEFLENIPQRTCFPRHIQYLHNTIITYKIKPPKLNELKTSIIILCGTPIYQLSNFGREWIVRDRQEASLILTKMLNYI